MPLDEGTIDTIHALLATEFNRGTGVIKNTLDLFAQGNTVPFVARYRKEVTRELDEVALRDIQARYASLVNLEERRESVLGSVREQGKLTPELEAAIRAATTLVEIEDLYLPFKPRRLTRAQKAREAGLEPLATTIMDEQPVEGDREAILAAYINSAAGIETVKDALDGAAEIIAETVSEIADVRKLLREVIEQESELRCKAIGEAGADGGDAGSASGESDAAGEHGGRRSRETYRDYFEFSQALVKLKPYQVLAINRGENEGVLDVDLAIKDEEYLTALQEDIVKEAGGLFATELRKAVEQGYGRATRTIKRETWVHAIMEAKTHAIGVFAENVRKLLLQPPLKGRRIVGVDPGYRNGCKIAVIDEQGKLLDTATVYPHPPQNRTREAAGTLLDLARKHRAFTFTIGNGTASRETETLLADLAKQEPAIEYTITSEAGASVYSTSDVAREEFPDLDVNIRSAVSIARRVLDPLPELIKIDPRSIGVGLYQHDVNQAELAAKLDAVVEDCVNLVGVDVNTASVPLLKHVSGLNARVAKEIVAFRDASGPFPSRDTLKGVKFLGDKTFEQAAGFLRVLDGTNPLDATAIHPESYPVAEAILAGAGFSPRDLLDPERLDALNRKLLQDPGLLSRHEGTAGAATLKDIVAALRAPRRDPRDALDPVILKKDVLHLEDLQTGMILKGTVRNVVDFGAFVDIGLKFNGLVHVSQIAARFVKNPHEHLSVGQVVDVMVKEIDVARQRIQLSIKDAARARH